LDTIDGVDYTLFSDGSIAIQLPEGPQRFGWIDELRQHLAASAKPIKAEKVRRPARAVIGAGPDSEIGPISSESVLPSLHWWIARSSRS
jgi:hypothetical protein